MSFSTGWQDRFAEGNSQSLWPWSDVISYTMRHARPEPGARVLELGCGVGANIPFFLSRQVQYYAIEGSEAAVKAVRTRFPELSDRIAHGDFTTPFPFAGPFDIILDRSAVTHNDHASIKRALALAYTSLREGGHYVGIDWFSSRHVEAKNGNPTSDQYTRRFETGLFAGVGNVHFSDEVHMRDLFSAYALVALDEKLYERCEPPPRSANATWIIVARKG